MLGWAEDAKPTKVGLLLAFGPIVEICWTCQLDRSLSYFTISRLVSLQLLYIATLRHILSLILSRQLYSPKYRLIWPSILSILSTRYLLYSSDQFLILPTSSPPSTTSTMPSLIRLANLTSKHLTRRKLTSGAKAGIGVAVALAAVIAIGVAIFFIVRRRRAKHLADIEEERAKHAGEKKKEEPKVPKRNKSIKDRLKGPLYQEAFEMPPAGPHLDAVDGQPLNHKPWAESSPRPSFSSKRGTRMMMMM
jgi:hypothetical protein